MKRLMALGMVGALLIAGPAQAADQKPKRATAEDLANALSSHSRKAPVKGAAAPAAAPAALADAKTERRVVEGQVMHVGKRSLSLEYELAGEVSNEMLLPYAGHVKVEGVKALTDLRYGDRVKVGIEQTYRETEKGERVVLKTEAHVIALVQRAPETLTSPAEMSTP